MNKINVNGKFVLLCFMSVFLLSATIGNSFMFESLGVGRKTTICDSADLFPQAGKFYTLAGREFAWEYVDGKNVTTHFEEVLKWSVQDIVGDVAFVNRTYVEICIQPQTGGNYMDTYDFDYKIATNRTILAARWKVMSFDTTGFKGLNEAPLDEDVGEHTWAWFSTDLHMGAFVLVSWTWDRRFLGDMLYEVVDEEIIEILGEKQDCWMLRMPPVVTIDGTQERMDTYWVDKDTGIPLKMYCRGWALDESFGFESEYVLTNTNIELGPESAQPASPTYTLTAPATVGFPEAGKFCTWYLFESGWYMSGETNVTYCTEGLFTSWVVNVTGEEAFVHRILWFNYISAAEGVEELETVGIQYYNYTIQVNTREILSVAGSFYRINMTSLTHSGEDRTSQLAGDIGEETWHWLPKNLYLGAVIGIGWTRDMPWNVDNGTYTVTGEKMVNAFDKLQECWILYMPLTPSIDATWNYTETYYSDKDVGIALLCLTEGWTVDGDSASVSVLRLIHTNVDLGPSTYYLTITSTPGGTTNPFPGTYNYTEDSSHNVTAIPNPGYTFDHWLLDAEENMENPITIIIDANHTLKAFFVDDIPPEISVPLQDPPENVTEYKNVTVTVNVTDLGTGVYNVTLWYIIVNNGTSWMPLNMTEISVNTYQATIPGYINGTWIMYKIIAYDNNGNSAATDDIYGYHCVYNVIPEFQPAIIMPLFMIATLLAIIIYKRKQE